MHPGDRYPGGPELAATQDAPLPPDDLDQRARQEDQDTRRTARRWWAAAAWIAGCVALFAFLLRISLSGRVDSDGANNALQGWDLVHGHLLLHGWMIGDATFYFLELPLLGISDVLFGIGNLAFHVSSSLTYLIVVIFTVALAVTGSRGAARVARAGVVVAILAAPLVAGELASGASGLITLLEDPDHTGTTAFVLASFLLIDRLPARRFTAPLLCVLLCAGQLSDLTVRYVAVPAIVLICLYRVLMERKIRSCDALLAVAAAVSVPLESLLRAAMQHLSGYAMVQPKAYLAPAGQWLHHLAYVWLNLRILFGAVRSPDTTAATVGEVFGVICLLAAAFGLARVIWTWRRAGRAEQIMSVAIVVNIATYVVTPYPGALESREIVAVLPIGAALAARALIPARIARAARARVVAAVAALAALVPLAVEASAPPVTPSVAPLDAWLEAHGLTYGIAGYWDASIVTMQSGDKVKVRAVDNISENRTFEPIWETNALWYNPATYDPRFVIADQSDKWRDSVSDFERRLGKPAATYRVAGWVVLIYRANLLQRIGHYAYQPFPSNS